jgi:hypothetical protein
LPGLGVRDIEDLHDDQSPDTSLVDEALLTFFNVDVGPPNFLSVGMTPGR